MTFKDVFVSVETGLHSLESNGVVDFSVILFLVSKSKYAGFSLLMETVSYLPFLLIIKCYGFLSTIEEGFE